MRKQEHLTIYTIGHSTRTLEFFVRMLQGHEIEQVADVRTVPRSRKHPQFDRDTLPPVLEAEGIRYVHLKGLGGWRKPQPDSPNTAWRNDSFRGYADYMQTPEFAQNLEALIALARTARTAIMCAEGNPYRCHRSLISDALTVRGIQVLHITGITTAHPHELTAWAKVEGTEITYPAEEGERAA